MTTYGRARIVGYGRIQGFSLIEVMIAVLVLGVGLLAFALLQTMNVRFSQSANQRTQATNMAYEMLDQMRVNRVAAVQYAGNYATPNTNLSTDASCNPNGVVSPARFRQLWQCKLQYTLGQGASAIVTVNDGEVLVRITWSDASDNQTFDVGTRL